MSKNKEFMDLYSRQIGTYGLETMGRLISMRVVIVGLQGVGVETAKNLVLAGPGSVVLCDDEPAEVLKKCILIGALTFLSADEGLGS